jgi:hypothetical protein
MQGKRNEGGRPTLQETREEFPEEMLHLAFDIGI